MRCLSLSLTSFLSLCKAWLFWLGALRGHLKDHWCPLFTICVSQILTRKEMSHWNWDQEEEEHRFWWGTINFCNPWTEDPGRLQSMGSLRVRHDWATSLSLFTFVHWRRKWQPIPVFLPGESQGRWSLVGCRIWGRTESDTIEVT